MESNSGIHALLIVVVIALVLIESEVSILAWIYTHLKVAPILLANILHLLAQWDDAASSDKHWHTVKPCLQRELLTAVHLLVCPEVIPVSSLWKILRCLARGTENVFVFVFVIVFVLYLLLVPSSHGIVLDNLLLSVLRLCDRSSKDALTEHELIGNVPCLLVAGKVAEQWTHVAAIVACHLPCKTIEIWDETIAQANLLLDSIIHHIALLAKLPDLARSISAMTAEHRAEESILHPAHKEFLELNVLRCRA